MSLQELGASVVLEYSDGKAVVTGESVEFYNLLDEEDPALGYAPRPVFSLSSDNFDDLIAAYNAYTSTEG
jgi:hypothetical protein